MARLPQVGGDSGSWGQVLNDFLKQTHNEDGSLRANIVGAAELKPGAVTNAALADGTIQEAKLHPDLVSAMGNGAIADNSIAEAKLDNALRNKLNGGVADDSISTAKVQDSAITNAKISASAAIAMSKIDGLPAALSSKASTSDLANKANAADLAGKADNVSVVHVTGAETVAGVKSFTSAPAVPDGSFTLAKTSGLQAVLDGQADRLTSLETSAARIIYSSTPPESMPTGYVWGQILTTPPSDTTPPSTPTLDAITLNDGKPLLTWSAASDASGIARYNIYRNGLILGTATALTYLDSGALASTTYSYTVTAVDASPSALESTPSNSRSVTTSAPSFIGRTDLAVAFDPNTLTGANGSAVSSIPQSGGFLTATLAQSTVANQPTLNAAGINGRKSIVFTSASSQFMQAGLSTALTGATTTYLVYRASVPPSTSRTIFGGLNTSPYRGLGIVTTSSTSRIRVTAAGTSNFYQSADLYSPNTWRIAVIVQNASGTGTLYDHARTGQSFTLPDATELGSSMNSLRLGRASGSSSSYTDMEWAGLYIFNTAHNATDVASGITYLEGLTGLSAGA